MPSAAAVRVALLLLLSALLLCGLRTAAAQSLAFSLVTATAGWSARDSLGAFEWSGQVWIAGGFTGGQEVWSSGDLGRTWVKSNTSLSTGFTNNCILNQNALVYANAVYLACDQYATQKNSDPALVAAWTALNGVGALVNNHYRESMSVVRMAVPFDGVGTLIAINDYDDELGINYNDVSALHERRGHVAHRWPPRPMPHPADGLLSPCALLLLLLCAQLDAECHGHLRRQQCQGHVDADGLPGAVARPLRSDGRDGRGGSRAHYGGRLRQHLPSQRRVAADVEQLHRCAAHVPTHSHGALGGSQLWRPVLGARLAIGLRRPG